MDWNHAADTKEVEEKFFCAVTNASLSASMKARLLLVRPVESRVVEIRQSPNHQKEILGRYSKR
jgi:hypothetical protein